jgi:hypothetical protein
MKKSFLYEETSKKYSPLLSQRGWRKRYTQCKITPSLSYNTILREGKTERAKGEQDGMLYQNNYEKFCPGLSHPLRK